MISQTLSGILFLGLILKSLGYMVRDELVFLNGGPSSASIFTPQEAERPPGNPAQARPVDPDLAVTG